MVLILDIGCKRKVGEYTSAKLNISFLQITISSKEIDRYIDAEGPESISRIALGKIVLVSRKHHLRLNRKMLGHAEIQESSGLSANPHIRTHGMVIAGDNKVAQVSPGQHTAGHQSWQFLLVQ